MVSFKKVPASMEGMIMLTAYEKPKVAVLVDCQNMLGGPSRYAIEPEDILDVAALFGDVQPPHRYICTSSRIPYAMKDEYRAEGWQILQGTRSADGYVSGKAVQIAARCPDINRIVLATGDAYAEGAIDIIKETNPDVQTVLISSSEEPNAHHLYGLQFKFAYSLPEKPDYFVFLESRLGYFDSPIDTRRMQPDYFSRRRPNKVPLISLLSKFEVQTREFGEEEKVFLQGRTERGLRFLVGKVPGEYAELGEFNGHLDVLRRRHEKRGGVYIPVDGEAEPA